MQAGAYGSLPFGDDLAVSGTDLDPLHFAGLDHDYESGLDHAQYREYSSAQAHWMSPDPYSGSYDWANPQSLNRYSYVMNNPLSLTDPSGQDCTDEVDPSTNTIYCSVGGSGLSGGDGGLIGDLIDFGEFIAGLFGGPHFNGSLQPRPVAPSNPRREFLPSNASTCTRMGRQFYAPGQFNLSNVTAAGHAGGKINIFAMNRAVGQFGTFYYQRAGTPSSFTFYKGLTPVSNMDVGAYLYGAGFTQSQAGTISNTFADLFSSNAGDPNQVIYRDFGYQLAARGGSYACLAIPQ